MKRGKLHAEASLGQARMIKDSCKGIMHGAHACVGEARVRTGEDDINSELGVERPHVGHPQHLCKHAEEHGGLSVREGPAADGPGQRVAAHEGPAQLVELDGHVREQVVLAGGALVRHPRLQCNRSFADLQCTGA